MPIFSHKAATSARVVAMLRLFGNIRGYLDDKL